MQDKPMFWTVFKADLLFSLCSISIGILLTVVIARWRKWKMRKVPATQAPIDGPRVVIVGGTNPKPGHCPLCGLDWPMPGPVITAPPAAAPGAPQSDERCFRK